MDLDLKVTTAELAADIRAHLKSLDFKTIEKLRKAKDENGSFDVIISTEDLDRSGEIVRQNGWELENYKNNPIVLWSHDYYSLPIGICTETYETTHNGVPATGAKGVFYPADINPLAQQIRRMYEFGVKSGMGVGCTTSVGFIPKEFDNENGRIITRAELLEFSFVPIPANQGVGPAEGRKLTFQEAKELGLDVAELRVKGIEFVEAEEKGEEPDKKEAQAGDSCQMDDGSPGTLGADADGNLVCQPVADKSAEAGKPLQKKLLKAVGEEHARHTGEVEKALDEFREKAVVEDQPDMNDDDEKKKAKAAAAHAEAMREHLKDLRSGIADEHTMHRAKSIASFRDFEGGDEKSFDKKPHLKALRDAHEDYETKCGKSLDQFEEKCTKSVQGEEGTTDEHTDWITGRMEEHQRAHKKAVVKIAKAMCKDAFGEEDQADEKTLEILKEYLAPHVAAQLLPAVAAKIGSKLSAATKEKLGEAHTHLKAATAVVEALHGGLRDSDGEEDRSGEDDKSLATVPQRQRSRPARAANTDNELEAHMFAREVLREITTVATSGLEKINKDRKARK
jgi:hypothetical protein